MTIDKHYIFSVASLFEDNKLTKDAPKGIPILYRWWFPEDSEVFNVLREYISSNPKDYDMSYLYSKLKRQEIGEKQYYALYLGKSINGQHRFKNHIKGPMSSSTLRRTVSALLQTKDEVKISSVLSSCYYEWVEFSQDSELIDSVELMAISLGYYPLNLDGNHAISQLWKTSLTEKRN